MTTRCGYANQQHFLFTNVSNFSILFQVTFLPLLSEPCSFDLLVYTNKTAVVPKKWEDSDPRYIMNSQEVKLRSFTTSVSCKFDLYFCFGCQDLAFLCHSNLMTIRFPHHFKVSSSGFYGHLQRG